MNWISNILLGLMVIGLSIMILEKKRRGEKREKEAQIQRCISCIDHDLLIYLECIIISSRNINLSIFRAPTITYIIEWIEMINENSISSEELFPIYWTDKFSHYFLKYITHQYIDLIQTDPLNSDKK